MQNSVAEQSIKLVHHFDQGRSELEDWFSTRVDLVKVPLGKVGFLTRGDRCSSSVSAPGVPSWLPACPLLLLEQPPPGVPEARAKLPAHPPTT